MRVGAERGLGVGHGLGERPGAEADLGAEGEQRADAVVGLVPARLVHRRRDGPVRLVEAVGHGQGARGEADHDRQDRVGAQRFDRPLRQRGRELRRLAGHRHLGGGDRELHRPVQLSALDALAQPSGATQRRAARGQGPPADGDHVTLDVQRQRGIRVVAGGERALDELDGLGRVVHADHRRERARRVEPGDGVLRRLEAPAQMLDRRLAVERERLREPELEQHGGAAVRRRGLLERAAQIGDRGVGRTTHHCLARGVAEPIARPLRAARLGREQMRGHPLRGGVLRRQHARGALVARRARGARELLVAPRCG